MARIARKTKKLTIYLTDRQYDEIFMRADNLGVGLSVMISLAVNEFIENDKSWYPTIEEVRQIEMNQLQLEKNK